MHTSSIQIATKNYNYTVLNNVRVNAKGVHMHTVAAGLRLSEIEKISEQTSKQQKVQVIGVVTMPQTAYLNFADNTWIPVFGLEATEEMVYDAGAYLDVKKVLAVVNGSTGEWFYITCTDINRPWLTGCVYFPVNKPKSEKVWNITFTPPTADADEVVTEADAVIVPDEAGEPEFTVKKVEVETRYGKFTDIVLENKFCYIRIAPAREGRGGDISGKDRTDRNNEPAFYTTRKNGYRKAAADIAEIFNGQTKMRDVYNICDNHKMRTEHYCAMD